MKSQGTESARHDAQSQRNEGITSVWCVWGLGLSQGKLQDTNVEKHSNLTKSNPPDICIFTLQATLRSLQRTRSRRCSQTCQASIGTEGSSWMGFQLSGKSRHDTTLRQGLLAACWTKKSGACRTHTTIFPGTFTAEFITILFYTIACFGNVFFPPPGRRVRDIES